MTRSKAAAAEAKAAEAKAEDQAETGTCGWAMTALARGTRVSRAAWLDGKMLDPKSMGGGFALSLQDVMAEDWRAV